jgi:hypothetical protein
MNDPLNTRRLSRSRARHRNALNIAGAALLLALWMPASPGSSALAVPPLHGTRSTPYPAAFCAFMEVRYGEYWMHTVQERIVRRAYIEWCQKQSKAKPKPPERRR